jgi:two-component system LytT family sensor kinase
LVPVFIFHNASDNTGVPGNFFFITNIFHIGLFYFNAYFLYPKLFTYKRWWIYILTLVSIIIVSIYFKIYLLKFPYHKFIVHPVDRRIIFFPTIVFLIASIIFRAILDRLNREKIEKEREAERLSSELKFLRSQISPHFLFNMMTNMVSLARQKSDMLEPSLLKLSDLLRYMLYESGEEKFPLVKEIGYLKNYIELQQLRFGENVKMQVDIQDDDADCDIEPMLLIPFVENAFKHGIGIVDKPFITIKLDIEAHHLFFSVINNYSNQRSSKDKNPGIGLTNVKNRLNLLYPGKHELFMHDSDGIYIVKLNLDLS